MLKSTEVYLNTMKERYKKFASNLIYGVTSLALVIVSTLIFYFLFNTNTVIYALENNQISVYYIRDVILLLAIIFGCTALSITTIEFVLKIDLNFFTVFLSPIFIILLSAYFAISYDYGNIARSKIGWFYKMPKGEHIGYPKIKNITINLN